MTYIVRFKDNKCWFCYISFSRRMKIVCFNSFFDCFYYIAIHTFPGFSRNLNNHIPCNDTFFALFWKPQDDLVILFMDVLLCISIMPFIVTSGVKRRSAWQRSWHSYGDWDTPTSRFRKSGQRPGLAEQSICIYRCPACEFVSSIYYWSFDSFGFSIN